MRTIWPILTLAALSLLACAPPSTDVEGAAGTPAPDALAELARVWAEAYREVDAGFDGAGTDVAALIDGNGDFAFASRALSDQEKEGAQRRGFDPVEHEVGLDALAIYLHHDNPAEWLSVPELAKIYGAGGAVDNWNQLMEYAVPGCEDGPIARFSRPLDAGAELFFQAAVLGPERTAKDDSHVFDDPKVLVERVKKVACAIGYGSMVHAIEHVKLACLSTGENAEALATRDGIADSDDIYDCVVPSPATAADRSYPLTRPLWMLTRGEPRGAVKAYLDWILSDAGQCALQDRGIAPVRPVACG